MADIDLFQDESDENIDDGYGFEDGLGENDDSLGPLERLQQYLDSDNIFNRQMVARTILDTLRAVGEDQERCSTVLDCMAKLSLDIEPSVRSELMEQVPHIAVHCQERKQVFYDAMPGYILPMVVRYLNDANSQVRKTSQAALLVLLEQGLVEKEDIEKQVVNVILELASPSSLDDYRTEAVALMSKMAPLLGRDITERMFLPRFVEMLGDPLFHVRKVCAANFGEVCSVVGVQNSEEILLPKLYSLCEDGVWGVRKACAECFMTISCACSAETRRRYLTNLFVELLADQSRWVRMSAFQQLGPFISTFADSQRTGLYVDQDGTILQLEDGTESPTPEDDVEEGVNFTPRCSPLSEAQEMELVLSDLDEGKGDSTLVMRLGDDDPSPEEQRAARGSGEGDDSGKGMLEQKMADLTVEGQRKDCGDQQTQEEGPSLDCVGAIKESEDTSTKSDSAEEDVDKASIVSLASSTSDVSQLTVSSSGSPGPRAVASDNRVHLHMDNSSFNAFQYWRSPLPEVDIDFDLINGAPANIHVVAKVKDEEKHKVYSTHVDVVMSKDDAGSFSAPPGAGGSQCRELEMSGVKIHTASVSTIRDTDQAGGYPRDMAVHDGLATDMSGGLGYLDYMPHPDFDDAFLAQQQDIIPQSLLENYLGMVEPSRAQTVDTEITRHCAYNLPAVAYTLGRHNWHCIKHLYETLAQALQWKVRRTLAFSIHEMALIEGEEILHRDLLPVFDGFLKDLDEVRIGVLKHLAHFFRLLRPRVRQQYLAKVSDFMKTDNNQNWRFRQELAEQLIVLCELFEPAAIVHHICPLAFALCNDKVAQVRSVTFGLVSAVVRQVYEKNEDDLLNAMCSDLIDQFAQNMRWLPRQIYAQLCWRVLGEGALPPDVFTSLLLPALLALSHDPVPNVRLSLARVLHQRVLPLDFFTTSQNPQHQQLLEALHSLQQDADRDVRYFSCQQDFTTATDIPHQYHTVPV